MAAKIKLKRVGKKKKPFYRIVIQDESKATKSAEVDNLGTYDPLISDNNIKFDEAKTKDWLAKGATPTDRVRILLGKAGILPPVSFEGKKKKLSKAELAKTEEEKTEDKGEAKGEVKEEAKGEVKEEAKAEAKVVEKTPTKEEKAETKEAPKAEVKEEKPKAEEKPKEEAKAEETKEAIKEEEKK